MCERVLESLGWEFGIVVELWFMAYIRFLGMVSNKLAFSSFVLSFV